MTKPETKTISVRVTVDDYERINDLRFDRRDNKLSQTLLYLLAAGLEREGIALSGELDA